ncbi:hypothetical protein BsWGS_00957 [Bradybaena similaris]
MRHANTPATGLAQCETGKHTSYRACTMRDRQTHQLQGLHNARQANTPATGLAQYETGKHTSYRACTILNLLSDEAAESLCWDTQVCDASQSLPEAPLSVF